MVLYGFYEWCVYNYCYYSYLWVPLHLWRTLYCMGHGEVGLVYVKIGNHINHGTFVMEYVKLQSANVI